MNQKHLFLIILLIACVIVSGCGQSSEVRWFKRGGLQVVNGEAQYTFSLIQPENGEPTFEELTQLALDRDTSFFTGVRLVENRFKDFPEALATTMEIADRCRFELPIGKSQMPIVPYQKE